MFLLVVGLLASVKVLAAILATFFGGECYHRVIMCSGTHAVMYI